MLSDISSLTDFDTYRQDKLYTKIQDFDKKINGGNHKFGDNPDQSSEYKNHVIESMAISGGMVSPERFESASSMPIGTRRRTLSGIFKVGWDWQPRSGRPPMKKWFPVAYGWQPLPSMYRVPNRYYGIPTICPSRFRYGYVCPKGAVHKDDKDDKKEEEETLESLLKKVQADITETENKEKETNKKLDEVRTELGSNPGNIKLTNKQNELNIKLTKITDRLRELKNDIKTPLEKKIKDIKTSNITDTAENQKFLIDKQVAFKKVTPLAGGFDTSTSTSNGFRFNNAEPQKEVEYTSISNDFRPLALRGGEKSLQHLVDIAERMKHQLDRAGIHYKNSLYEKIKDCAVEIDQNRNKAQTNCSCLLNLTEELKNFVENQQVKEYFQSLLNVMNHHMFSFHKNKRIYGGILRQIRGRY